MRLDSSGVAGIRTGDHHEADGSGKAHRRELENLRRIESGSVSQA